MAANKEEIMKFSCEIEKIVKEKNLSYIDAIIFYCEKTELEPQIAAKMISSSIKSNIRTEAEQLNFLQKSDTSRLPL